MLRQNSSLVTRPKKRRQCSFFLTSQIVNEKVEEEFYCPVCEKSFKTENQLKNHEKSKLHLKKMKELLADVTLESEKHLIENVEKKLENLRQDGTQQGGGGKKKKKKKKNKNKGNEESQDTDSPQKKSEASWSLPKNKKTVIKEDSESESEEEVRPKSHQNKSNPAQKNQKKPNNKPIIQEVNSESTDSEADQQDSDEDI